MKSWSRIPFFWRVVLVFVLLYAFVKFGIRPALPGSVVILYTGFIILGFLIYITLEDSRIESFISFLRIKPGESKSISVSRWALVVLLPLLAGYNAFQSALPKYTPPAQIFQMHPTPPDKVLTIQAPPWAADPARWDVKDIAQGKELYKANCQVCHGENLDGNGPAAAGFRYPVKPASFRDRGTISQLTLQYVYWKVTDGGIQNQFNTAMPRWVRNDETVHTGDMTSDEAWRVIIFLYAETGYTPRAGGQHNPH